MVFVALPRQKFEDPPPMILLIVGIKVVRHRSDLYGITVRSIAIAG